MKWLNIVIKYRLWIGIVLLALAIYTNIQAGFWPSFILYFLALIAIVGHFIMGPMRLIQSYMEEGDMEGAKKVIASIWFPGLLIKPVRSVYYTVKGNLAMVENDYDGAEKNLKKSNQLMQNSTLMKGQMGQAEGANKLQLGMEMFEADQQLLVNDYMDGLINEDEEVINYNEWRKLYKRKQTLNNIFDIK